MSNAVVNDIGNNAIDKVLQSESLKEIQKIVDNIDAAIEDCPFRQKTKLTETNEPIQPMTEEKKKLYKTVNTIKVAVEYYNWCTESLSILTELVADLPELISNIIGEPVDIVTEALAQGIDYLLNFILEKIVVVDCSDRTKAKTVALYKKLASYYYRLQKMILKGLIWIFDKFKSILEDIKKGKISGATSMIYGQIVAVIQKVNSYIIIAIKCIRSLIQMVPVPFAIDGQGMSFFITPKVPTNLTATPILNGFGGALSGAIKETVYQQYDNLVLESETANKAAQDVTIASIGAQAMAGEVIPNIDTSKIVKRVDLDAIMNTINTTLATVFEPEPLPKYERLSITNMGFLSYLLTGWCPAGKLISGDPLFR